MAKIIRASCVSHQLNPSQQYCDGHGIGLVSWNWDCLAVVSGMFQKKVPQNSLGPRTSWCGSRCGVGRGQDLVVRMSIYCRHTLGVPRRPSVPVHIENLDPAAGGLRQLDPTAFSVCAVLVNAPSARLRLPKTQSEIQIALILQYG